MPTGEIIRPNQPFNANGGGADAVAVEAARAQWKDHLSGKAKTAHMVLRGLQALEEIGGIALIPAAIAPLADLVGIPAEAVDGLAIAATTAFKTAVQIHGENIALREAGLGQYAGGAERFFSQAFSVRGLTPLG